jgi:hypothetical protein
MRWTLHSSPWSKNVQPENRESTAEVVAAEAEIEQARLEMAGAMTTMEQKIASTLDWRVQFQRHPAAFLGTAAGLGYLIARLL